MVTPLASSPHGDLDALRADLAGHAAIARAFGPYKLSLHSGSDKFSVYPLAMEATGGMVHLKTAGTSMLAAQQAIAMTDPALFRQLYALAFERFAVDRASYHISADPARAPQPDRLADGDLNRLGFSTTLAASSPRPLCFL